MYNIDNGWKIQQGKVKWNEETNPGGENKNVIALKSLFLYFCFQ